MMTRDDLELQNLNYNTAFYLAASAGNTTMVKIMMEKNKGLLTIPGSGGNMMPLYMAALYGYYDVALFIYQNSSLHDDDGWNPHNRGWLLEKCVENNMFDIAQLMVEKHPELASNGNALGTLARMPEAFSFRKTNFIEGIILWVLMFLRSRKGAPLKENQALSLLRTIWKAIAEKPKSEIDDIVRGPKTTIRQGNNTRYAYPSRLLFVAAKMGNTNFVIELIHHYPDLIWKVDDNNQTIFHIAVKNRHEGIYNLLYEIGAMKDIITPLKDINDNNMLHLVSLISEQKQVSNASGVGLQMQRELLWFREVKGMIPPSYRARRNRAGLTPHELFTREHRDLAKQDEKWMKEIAGQCMVVAALIATMVFTAAYTMPGGYNQENGIPIFHSKTAYKIFVVADAVSLLSSTTSILYMFVSVFFSSNYSELDFLESLPKKLILGLLYLSVSIISMLIAFSVSFFILYLNGMLWIPVLISVFALIPFYRSFKMFYLLLDSVIRMEYGSKYLFKPNKPVLYYENPQV